MLFLQTHLRSLLKYLGYFKNFLTSNLHTSYCILNKYFFCSKICFPSEVQGTQQEGIESLFFLKKSAISQNHVKIFDSPDSKFSSLSSHRVFSSLMVTLFKKVIIEKLPRKKCTRIYTKGILDSASREKMVFVFIKFHQNNLSRYYAIISYFSCLPNRKSKKYPVA